MITVDNFYSEYAKRPCLGVQLDNYTARKVWGILSSGFNLGGNPRYELLANEQTRRFGTKYNLIITSLDEKSLEPIKELIVKIIDKLS